MIAACAAANSIVHAATIAKVEGAAVDLTIMLSLQNDVFACWRLAPSQRAGIIHINDVPPEGGREPGSSRPGALLRPLDGDTPSSPGRHEPECGPS